MRHDEHARGGRPPVSVGRGVNCVLAALSPADRAAIAAHLEPVDLDSRQVLAGRDQPTRHVYFPETAVCSVIAVMTDGEVAESLTIGCDGIVGLHLALGVDSVPFDTIVQVPGRAQRLAAEVFRGLLDTSPSARAVLHRHMQAMLMQSFQSTACNRLHSLRERCCRWLLLTHDRVAGDEFRLTQDLLALMVGVRRPSVTLTVRRLAEQGIVKYARGRFRILDRAALEQRSCECYEAVREHMGRLFPAREAGRPAV